MNHTQEMCSPRPSTQGCFNVNTIMPVVTRYIGAPYAPCGRGPAFDCWGLVRQVIGEVTGCWPADYSGQYTSWKDPRLPALLTHEAGCWQSITPGSERPCDVVLIDIGGLPRHVGLVIGGKRMLHIYRTSLQAVIERYDNPLWEQRIRGFYRYN